LSADPHLATALEGSFKGNRGKELQSDVVLWPAFEDPVAYNFVSRRNTLNVAEFKQLH